MSAYFGFERSDPSFNWVIVTVEIFVAFNGIKLHSQTFSNIIEWTAKRSYSIYLLQYATIELATSVIYNGVLDGGYSTLSWPLRIATWILATALAYGLALAVASVVDPFIIGPIQVKLKQYRQNTAC